MRPPEYLMVRPTDIGRVGALGAAILALVRYVTGLPGEANGRRLIDGEMWWRASHDDIGQALGGGISRRTVSWTVRKLQDAGDLFSAPTEDFYGDRAQAYRAADMPSDVPLARSDQPIGKIRPPSSARSDHPGCTGIANLPPVGELEKSYGVERRRGASRGTHLPDGWMPECDVIDAMRIAHPGVDLRAEHAKFVDYWDAKPGAGGRKLDWNATWRNWIRRAAEHAAGTRGRSAVEANTNGWLGYDPQNGTARVGGMW